jgi:hypothetical protein
MRTSWRSWFWNIVLAICMFGFFVVGALGIGMAPGLGDGIVMRGFGRTTTIPWAEVEEITHDGPVPGMAGLAGATAPVVVRRRPDGATERTELAALGGYGVSLIRPTPAERAIVALTAHLERWRQASPSG